MKNIIKDTDGLGDVDIHA